MLSLDATTKSLEIKLAGAVATTELPFVASYVDINQSSFAMTGSGESDGVTNGSTAVTAAAAPAATTTRKLNYLSVVNVDTAAVTLTVQVNNAATKRISFKATLQVGDQLSFTDAGGWVVFDSTGSLKEGFSGILPAANFPALSGDVTTSAGSTVTAIGALKVTNAMLAGSIAASKLVGSDITTVGTITVGVWNAGAVTSSGALTGTLGNFSNIVTINGATASVTALALKIASATVGYVSASGFAKGTSASDLGFFTETGKGMSWMVNGSATDAMTLSSAGLLIVSGFGSHTFSASGVGGNTFTIRNSSAGTGNYGALFVGNDTSATLGTFLVASSTATFGGIYPANSLAVESTGAGGISIAPTHASGAIRFYSGGTTEAVRIHASRGVSVGDTTDPGATNFRVAGIVSFAGTNTTGAGIAGFGANSPASTLTAPYTWIQVKTADGSTAYIPCWK